MSYDSRENDFNHIDSNAEELKQEGDNVSVQNFELKPDHPQRPIWIAYTYELNKKITPN